MCLHRARRNQALGFDFQILTHHPLTPLLVCHMHTAESNTSLMPCGAYRNACRPTLLKLM
jgi:hypothetical protein